MKNKNIKNYNELATRLMISPSQLSQLLNDSYCPIKKNTLLLMNALDLKLQDTIHLKEDKNMNKYEQLDLFLLDDDSKEIDYINENKKYQLNKYEEVSNYVVNKQYDLLETFAGAGGLSIGLEAAGLKPKLAIEIDKYAAQTLINNSKSTHIINDDINNVLNNNFKGYDIEENLKIDVLSGGYPCQSFSYAGKRKGLADIRGTLFQPYADLISKLNPKIFIAENVKGLVNHDNGKTLHTMIKVFKDKGYKIFWNIFNAWDYDVAQKRQRIFIIGIRQDLIDNQKVEFRFPSPQEYKPVLRDVLIDVPESPGVTYPERKLKVMELVPPGGCWVDLPDSVAREYMGASYFSGGGRRGMARRLSWEEPSLTLTTSPNQKQTERCHPDETRPLTVREYARIQGFPDDWIFSGSIGNQYKQIGNAVPIPLAKYIGLSVNKYLSQFYDI